MNHPIVIHAMLLSLQAFVPSSVQAVAATRKVGASVNPDGRVQNVPSGHPNVKSVIVTREESAVRESATVIPDSRDPIVRPKTAWIQPVPAMGSVSMVIASVVPDSGESTALLPIIAFLNSSPTVRLMVFGILKRKDVPVSLVSLARTVHSVSHSCLFLLPFHDTSSRILAPSLMEVEAKVVLSSLPPVARNIYFSCFSS